MTPRFLSSDVWVLQAAAAAAREAAPVTLAELIAAADMINHAIPTREELNGAIGRLGRAEYLTATAAGTVSLTPSGRALFTFAWARGTFHAHGETLMRKLGAQPWSAAADPAAAGEGEPEVVPSDVYEAAIATYLGQQRI
jgi:hypothetical protein